MGIMQGKKLHSLIPLLDFKAVLSVDDREESLSRYCLITATYTIEQHCMRKLLEKKHFEQIDYTGDVLLPLKEYPVRKVFAVYVLGSGEILEPEFYEIIPECGTEDDLPFSISISSALRRYRYLYPIKVVYAAGYATGQVPADLASACLELAAWNMARYRGRKIGVTGSMRGNGKNGECLEASMPENVRHLLEPYRRKVI